MKKKKNEINTGVWKKANHAIEKQNRHNKIFDDLVDKYGEATRSLISLTIRIHIRVRFKQSITNAQARK